MERFSTFLFCIFTHFLNEQVFEEMNSLSFSGCVRIRVGEHAPLGGGSDKSGIMP